MKLSRLSFFLITISTLFFVLGCNVGKRYTASGSLLIQSTNGPVTDQILEDQRINMMALTPTLLAPGEVLGIEIDKNAKILRVQATASDPTRAAEICNLWMKKYRESEKDLVECSIVQLAEIPDHSNN